MTGAHGNPIAIALFGLIAVFVGADLLADAGSGAGTVHLAAEGLATLTALVGAGWFAALFAAQRREAWQLRQRTEELLAGVGQSIDEQFADWKLTVAEAQVALLLLKGLSFKEIAIVRQTTERTAREQARGVYKKAGVAGRAELSAWFIEDLLAPTTPVRPSERS